VRGPPRGPRSLERERCSGRIGASPSRRGPRRPKRLVRVAQGHRGRPAAGSRRRTPSYKFTSTKLRTPTPPTSSAAREPGEVATCEPSVAYWVGGVRRSFGAYPARTSPILSSFDQIVKLAAYDSKVRFGAVARQHGFLVRSSPARDLATVLGRRHRPLGVRVPPSHRSGSRPAGGRTAHFLSPAVVLARRRHEATRASATSLSTRHPRLNRHLSRARECAGAR
jgi:hypothetical protein